MNSSRFAERRDKLRKLVRKSAADALLVTNFTNVTYLTGFTGDDSYLLVTREREVLLSDPRYTTQIEGECPGLEMEIRQPGISMLDVIASQLAKAKVGRLGVEATSITVAVRDEIAERLSKVELVSTSDLVEELRVVKDKQEIERIRHAAWQARRAFEAIRAALTPEQTERQVAADLEHQLRKLGAKGASFPPIVAVGSQAALPHARPTDRRIGESDFTLVDWGSNEGLYMSDLTRMVVTGKLSPKLERVYGVVLKAQLAGIAAIRAGVTCGEVDHAARQVIAKAGFDKQFGHGLGHGIGLEIHEAPRLGKNQQTVLKPGMIVTVEPGIYLPGWGGVRIEDDVLVTRGGHELLSDVPKELADCVVV